MDIGIDGLHKRFGTFAALRGIDLHIPSGQLLAVLGPSGAGKTTLLRLLAGLERPDSGRIRFDDRDAAALSLRQRRVGLVFQHYALFPHLSVFENVAFGLRCLPRRQRPAEAELTHHVDALLDRLQIAGLRARRPEQISGGQQQRVALARAMAIDPSVLLLDEPFGALDAKVRHELRRWLRQIHDQTGYTTVFVTHDQDEALDLADRVVIMHEGKIVQDGAPAQIYAEPASAFVFDFLGRSNRLEGHVQAGWFHPDGGQPRFACAGIADGPACMFIRPHDLALADEEGLSGHVLQARRLGARGILALELPQQPRPLEIDISHDPVGALPAAGSLVHVRPQRYRVFASRS